MAPSPPCSKHFFPPRLPSRRAAGDAAGKNAPPPPVSSSPATTPNLPPLKDLLPPQHVVQGPRQLRPQHRQRLRLAALLLLPLQPRLGPRALPQPQTRRLGKRPAQMRVADLLAP